MAVDWSMQTDFEVFILTVSTSPAGHTNSSEYEMGKTGAIPIDKISGSKNITENFNPQTLTFLAVYYWIKT